MKPHYRLHFHDRFMNSECAEETRYWYVSKRNPDGSWDVPKYMYFSSAEAIRRAPR